jgi:hypothetical protein
MDYMVTTASGDYPFEKLLETYPHLVADCSDWRDNPYWSEDTYVYGGRDDNNAAPSVCPYCGMYHSGMCPRIKLIEYHPNGQIKRIEFYDERTPQYAAPLTTAG